MLINLEQGEVQLPNINSILTVINRISRKVENVLIAGMIMFLSNIQIINVSQYIQISSWNGHEPLC